MRHKYDIDRNGLLGYSGLGMAVVFQAVMDWRFLCNGGTPTADRNFSELEYFFEYDCVAYLGDYGDIAVDIYAMLQKERREAA